MLCGWESNRRSDVALAMRHRRSGIPTYGLNGIGKGDEHPTYAPLEYSGIINITILLFIREFSIVVAYCRCLFCLLANINVAFYRD